MDNLIILLLVVIGTAVWAFNIGWHAGRKDEPSDEWQHQLMTTMFAVILEGRSAHNYGIDVFDCPYSRGSPDARAWKLGWHKARTAIDDLVNLEAPKKPMIVVGNGGRPNASLGTD